MKHSIVSTSLPKGDVTVTANWSDNRIPGTNYERNLWNWILFIVFFGWLWM